MNVTDTPIQKRKPKKKIHEELNFAKLQTTMTYTKQK